MYLSDNVTYERDYSMGYLPNISCNDIRFIR